MTAYFLSVWKVLLCKNMTLELKLNLNAHCLLSAAIKRAHKCIAVEQISWNG